MMKWLDVYDIAIALGDEYPDENPKYISFTALKFKIMNLDDFHDLENSCNEKLLEAIQAAWIDEVQ